MLIVPGNWNSAGDTHQTAIRWSPASIDGALSRGQLLGWQEDLQLSKAVKNTIADRNGEPNWEWPFIWSAQIQGDMDACTVVRTRIGTVLKAESDFSKWWNLLEQCLAHFTSRRDAENIVSIINAAAVFEAGLHGNRRRRQQRFVFRGDYRKAWESGLKASTNASSELKPRVELPNDLDEIKAPASSVFDAREYWRDWFKREGDGEDFEDDDFE